jgi:hypothetical protein
MQLDLHAAAKFEVQEASHRGSDNQSSETGTRDWWYRPNRDSQRKAASISRLVALQTDVQLLAEKVQTSEEQQMQTLI